MNQNKNSKVKDFFRKEGFYLVLFVCLCVVATVATFTVRKNSIAKEQTKPNNEFTLNLDDNTSETEANFNNMQNADRVENNEFVAEETEETQEELSNVEQTEETASNETTEVAENEQTEVEVSGSNTEIKLSLPIDGNLVIAREFGKMVRTYSDDKRTEDISRKGIDVNATVGTMVKAAAEGKVEEVSKNTTDGNYVVIAHANGLKTIYTNLSEDIKVAAGDVVEAGSEIGAVGNSSGIFVSKLCGDVLNIQVKDANGKDVDPSSYFKFE